MAEGYKDFCDAAFPSAKAVLGVSSTAQSPVAIKPASATSGETMDLPGSSFI